VAEQKPSLSSNGPMQKKALLLWARKKKMIFCTFMTHIYFYSQKIGPSTMA
jgi:hypothetical protein